MTKKASSIPPGTAELHAPLESPDAGSARAAERQARGPMPPAAKPAGGSRVRPHAGGVTGGLDRRAPEASEPQPAADGGGAAAEAFARPPLALDARAAAELAPFQQAGSLLAALSPAAAALDYAQLSAAAAAVGALPNLATGALDTSAFAAHERVMLKQLVRQQVEYYFSAENLSKDAFLRSQMGERDGRVSLLTVTNFNRMRQLSSDLALIAEALGESDLVDISPEGVRPAVGWRVWLPGADGGSAGSGGGTSGALSPAGSAGGGPTPGSSGAASPQPAPDGGEGAELEAGARRLLSALSASGAVAGGARAPPLPLHLQMQLQQQLQMQQTLQAQQALKLHRASPVAAAAHQLSVGQLGSGAAGVALLRAGTGARRVSPTMGGSSDSELSAAETSPPQQQWQPQPQPHWRPPLPQQPQQPRAQSTRAAPAVPAHGSWSASPLPSPSQGRSAAAPREHAEHNGPPEAKAGKAEPGPASAAPSPAGGNGAKRGASAGAGGGKAAGRKGRGAAADAPVVIEVRATSALPRARPGCCGLPAASAAR